ncbi:predicted protein [Lichtheimia corymbifera JMRC:FSU:9682]|uniref:PH domain-containing protein n=1 Tax=Lichtheimia corymbifera JMRC:FSU:9682 TaxID=1263082 RepID=A0A068RIS0_9FUNG|nr:predicted protein [Lichtheimia corymbifera JMRC:FSU:9682]
MSKTTYLAPPSIYSHDYEGWLLISKLRRQLVWRPAPQRYYCILDGQRLSYYTRKNDRKPKGVLDLSRYRLITASPSCRGLLINRAPSQKSFQLVTHDKDLPDLMLVADSRQAKEEWTTYMDYQRSNNNVLDKWLERYDLSNEQLHSPPSPSISSISSASTSASSVVKSPIDCWQPATPTSPTTTMDMSGLIHSFISRRKSSPALNSGRRRPSLTPSASPMHSIMDSHHDY